MGSWFGQDPWTEQIPSASASTDVFFKPVDISRGSEVSVCVGETACRGSLYSQPIDVGLLSLSVDDLDAVDSVGGWLGVHRRLVRRQLDCEPVLCAGSGNPCDNCDGDELFRRPYWQ